MTIVNVNDYFRSKINEMTTDDFANYNPTANGIADDMCMMIVCNKDIDNKDAEDIIDGHFDDFVVMLYQRAAVLGVKFNNRLPANAKVNFDCEATRRSEYQ